MRQKSAEMLGLEDVADLVARCGIAADRRTVARALEVVEIDGVIAPTRRGDPWKIPQATLVEVLAAMLWRRSARDLALQGRPAGAVGGHRLDAARRMLAHDDLRLLVPRKIVATVRRADREADELREATRAWLAELEREEQELAEIADRERRAREARELAEVQERARRAREEKTLSLCYAACKRLARHDIGSPRGPDWPERTPHWNEDWPTERPAWWLPPPGMAERMAREPSMVPFGHVEPDWRDFVPRYRPGAPWPWRGRKF